MKSSNKFSKKIAENYDSAGKTERSSKIAELILKELNYTKNTNIMDFGSGTGLLLSQIAPYVNDIVAIDTSEHMNEYLENKKNTIKNKLEIIDIDLTKNSLDRKFDSIISSMTLHHIKDINNIFKVFYSLLNKNGSLAIADLDLEDGSFHPIDAEYFHNGFNRKILVNIVKNIGFKSIKIQDVYSISKNNKEYSLFLLTGKK